MRITIDIPVDKNYQNYEYLYRLKLMDMVNDLVTNTDFPESRCYELEMNFDGDVEVLRLESEYDEVLTKPKLELVH